MADTTLQDLKNHPRYQTYTPEQQQQADQYFTEQAWGNLTQDIDYSFGSEETKKAKRDSFLKAFPTGQQLVVDEEHKNNSNVENLFHGIMHSGEAAIEGVRSGLDISDDTLSEGMGERYAEDLNTARFTPTEYKQTQAALTLMDKKWDAAHTLMEKLKAVGDIATDAVSELVDNPLGVAYLAGDTLMFAAPGLAVGAAGGILGGLAGPLGAKAGLHSGRIAGQTLTEAGAYFQQAVTQEVLRRGLPRTAEGFNSVLTDMDFIGKIKSKAFRKGIGTAVVDSAFAGLTGRMASVKQAGALNKLKQAGKITGTEMLSEPISDSAGVLLAGDEVRPSEAMGELLGGIGAGPVMAPLNAAMHSSKVIGGVTSKKVKQAANPAASSSEAAKESLLKAAGKLVTKPFKEKSPEEILRAEAKAQNKKEEKELKQQAKTPTQYKYSEKVKEAAKTGEVDFKKDPIKSAETLLTMNQKEETAPDIRIENHEKSMEALTAMEEQRNTWMTEIRELGNKESITGQEEDRRMSLIKKTKSLNNIIGSVTDMVEKMNPSRKELTEEESIATIKEIKSAIKSGDNKTLGASILSMFGSKQDLPADLENTEGMEEVFRYQKAKEVLDAATEKSTSDVHTDVISGGEGYKGIAEYSHDIGVGLKAGNERLVNKQFTALQKFADRHSLKAKLFTKALNDGGTQNFTDSEKQSMEMFEQSRGAVYTFGGEATPMVNSIVAEAEALNAAVSAIDKLVSGTPVQETKPTNYAKHTYEQLDQEYQDLVAQGQKLPDGEEKTALRTKALNNRKIRQAKYAEEHPTLSANTPTMKKALDGLKKKLQTHKAAKDIQLVDPSKDTVMSSVIAMGKAVGITTHFFRSSDPQINKTLGVALPRYMGDAVFINEQSQDPYAFILGHEFGHKLKKDYPKLYRKLDTLVQKKDSFKEYKAELSKRSKGDWTEQSYNENPTEELISSLIGDQFVKKSFWEELYTEDKSLFKALSQIVQNALKTLKGKFTEAEPFIENLEEAQKAIKEVLREVITKESSNVLPLQSEQDVSENSQEEKTTDTKEKKAEKETVGSSTETEQAKAETGEEGTRDLQDGEETEEDIEVSEPIEQDPESIRDSITKPSIADPSNKVRNFFNARKSDATGILQKVGNSAYSFSVDMIRQLKVFTKEYQETKAARDMIKSLDGFNTNFQKAFDETFKAQPRNNNRATWTTIFKIANGLPKNDTKVKPEDVDIKISVPGVDPKRKDEFVKILVDLNADLKLFSYEENTTYTNEEIVAVIQQHRDKFVTRQESSAFDSFMVRFQNRIADSGDYRHRDTIQYLADQGVMPRAIRNALMAAAYEWISTTASGTLNNHDDTIKKMLGLSSGTDIHPSVRNKLADLGTPSNYLAESIGKTAYKLLDIKVDESADRYLEAQFIESLGLQAIAALQHMKYITQKNVFTGTPYDPKSETFLDEHLAINGFAGLKNFQKEPKTRSFQSVDDHFEAPEGLEYQTDETPTINEPVRAFYKLAYDLEGEHPVPRKDLLKRIIEPFRASPHTWSMIFRGELPQEEYLWTKPTRGKTAPFKKTPFDVAQEQIDMIRNHEQKPREVSHRTLAFYLLLGEENLKKVQGWQDSKTVHVANRKGADGVNLGLKRSNQAVQGWIDDVDSRNQDYASQFYVREEFWAQGRMGELGSIDMQGDKSHRALFNFSAWNQVIDLTDEQMNKWFMEAVAINLDQETTKTGGLQQAIDAAEEVLAEPEIKEAITAIQKIIKKEGITELVDPKKMVDLQEKYAPEMEIITAGVVKTKMNLLGMKALIEYARYQTAMAGPESGQKAFRTDLTTEIDGVSNGIAIGRLQLMGLDFDMGDTLAALENAGMFFSKKRAKEGLAKQLDSKWSFDAYKSTGFQWSNFLLRQEDELTRKRDKHNLKAFKAMTSIFGNLRDPEGLLDKMARKVSKAPTMTTVYGMQSKALYRSLTGAFITKVYEAIEEAVAAENMGALKVLNNQVYTLTGEYIWEGDIDLSTALETRLSYPAQNRLAQRVGEFHGKALENAIDAVYGDMKKAFEPLNNGISYAAALYNSTRNLRIQELKNQIEEKGEVRELTVKELRQIDKFVLQMFPFIKTIFHNKMALASRSRDKEYKGTQIQQEYANNLTMKKATPFDTGGIENPGVRGTILSIHNTDSNIAITMMDILDALNNHDGFTVGVGQGAKAALTANESFYKTMKEQHIGDALYQGVESVEKQYKMHVRELKKAGISAKDITESLNKELVKNKLNSILVKGTKKKWPALKTKEDVQAVRKAIMPTMKKVAAVTKRNKNKILNAVVGVEQYSFPGGVYYTEKPSRTITHKRNGIEERYKSSEIVLKNEEKLQVEEAAAQKLIASIKQAQDKFSLGSSAGKTEISLNPDDYAKAQQISSSNAVNIYNQIKNDSVIPVGSEHDGYLQRLLQSIVHRVMEPVDLYMKTDPHKETQGKFLPNKQQIFISKQNQIMGPVSRVLHQGIRMSTGEVYVHELLHNILHIGLSSKENARLRAKVKTLFNITKKHLDENGTGYKAFLNDPTIDVTDKAYEYEVAAAKERYNYIFNNTETTTASQFDKEIDPATGIRSVITQSVYLDEFVALGLSNENFMKYLESIDLTKTKYNWSSWKKLVGNNIQETLGNIFQQIMDFFYQKFSARKNSKHVASELHRLAVILSKQDTEQKSAMYETATKVDNQYNKIGEYANNYIKKALRSWPVTKTISELRDASGIVYESNTLLGQRMRESVYWFRRLDQGIIKSMVSEVQGRTDRVAWIHQLLSRRKLYLDAAKEAETAAYIAGANAQFTEDLKDSSKTSITKVLLKTDLVTLLHTYSVDGQDGLVELQKLLEDPAAIDTKIQEILKVFRKDKDLATWEHYYNSASESMGHFMVHSRAGQNEIVWQNPALIAELKNVKIKKKLPRAKTMKAEKLIDRLGSLYALKHTAQGHRAEVLRLFKSEPKGINTVLQMHAVLKDDALNKTFNGDRYKFIKGYTKQILNSRIGLTYGTLEDEAELKKAGFIRKDIPLQRDNFDPTRHTPIYVYTSKTGKVNNLLSGVFSFTSNKAKGTASDRLAKQVDLTTAQGALNNAAIMKKKAKVIQDMTKPGYTPDRRISNSMIPQVDHNGKVTQYRYMMSETTKNAHMEQITAFDTILGSMAGQVIDKTRTPEINEELIDGLKTMYDAEYDKNPGAYVEISPYTTNERHKEIYYMMPPAARKYLRTKWNGNKMFVSKDLVDIAFGYRKYSVVEAFTKKPEERAKLEKMVVKITEKIFKDNAIHRANTIEEAFTEMTGFAKSNIIVKSLYVTMGNLGSNMMYLKSRGVPVSKAIKLGWEAVVMGNKYQADMKKLNQLELQERMLEVSGGSQAKKTRLQGEIVRLKDTISRNPTKLTIEAGLLPSLVDDVETVTGGTNFPTAFEKKAEKLSEALPGVVRNVGKTLLLTEDTTAFKVLNNAVKMTDFVGRYVLYNHYTEQGMAHEKAIASVEDEFVNFNVPTHKMIEYGNMVGFLWFTKYGSRILKTIKDAAVDKPFHFFMALLMSNSMGLDNIANSTPGIKDMTGMLGLAPTTFLESTDELITTNTVLSVF